MSNPKQIFWDRVMEICPQDIQAETVKVVGSHDIDWLLGELIEDIPDQFAIVKKLLRSKWL